MKALEQVYGLILVLIVTGTLVVLVLLPPFVGDASREALMQAFSPLCHQMPTRSFTVHGVPLSVCHRCTGIVAGLLLAALLTPWLRRVAQRFSERAPLVLALSGIPMAVDWAGDMAGLWTNTPGSRVATGAVFGIVVGLMLARAFGQLVGAERTPPPGIPNTS